MRIGIDLRYLSHGLVGGVHTYVGQLVPPLLVAARDHQVFLYVDTKRPFELSDLPPNAVVRRLEWRNTLSSVYHDFMLRSMMARDCLDVAHFPANHGFGPASARTVLTLHDGINILPLREIIRGHPKSVRTIATMTYLHFRSRATVRRADLVLTGSRHAASEIIQRSRVDPLRVKVIPYAPPPDARRISQATVLADVRQRYGLPASFVLADALKNPAVLIKAWRTLPPPLRHAHKIVFFSRRPDVLPIVAEATGNGEAQLLVRLPREDLIALYSLARAFVFPSWIEGFGIPVLEAMACGAPLIASNRGAIPEVAGDAGLLVDAEDASSLAGYLAEVLGNPALADEMRRRGFYRAATFSWQRTAELTLDSYGGVMSAAQPGRSQPTPGR